MLLAEETTESEELVRRKETNSTNSIDGDDERHLNAIGVQIFSGGDNSNVLLDEVKDLFCSGEPSKDHSLKRDADQLACSTWSTYTKVTPGPADHGKESNGDEPHDDGFSADDLLRFAWQIAQGMVNNIRQLPFRACGWSLNWLMVPLL